MNASDLIRTRLKNQRLTSSEFKKPIDVLHWFGAMQAQDFNGAKWALAQRMRDATDTDIEKAFNEGNILRTHIMRPTWHFVAPDDIRWLLHLTASRVNQACGTNYRKLELDDSVFRRSNRALTRALQKQGYLTRAALKPIINEAGVLVNDPVRLAHVLIRAELDGLICSGPKVKNQFTYALLEERVRHTKILQRDESLAKLSLRYFASHGPATLRDFVWWSGLTLADAKIGISLAQRQLTKTVLEDQVYWTANDVGVAQRRSRSARLLPAFDEYLVAYKDRKAIIKENHPSGVDNNMLGPSIIIDGKLAGTWKRTTDNQQTTLALKPFVRLTATEKLAVAKEVERYARFIEMEVRLA